jgi:hypothetical protein
MCRRAINVDLFQIPQKDFPLFFLWGKRKEITAVNALTSNPRHLTPKTKNKQTQSSFFFYLHQRVISSKKRKKKQPFEYKRLMFLLFLDIFFGGFLFFTLISLDWPWFPPDNVNFSSRTLVIYFLIFCFLSFA